VAFHGQAAPLVVAQARPSGAMRGAEDPVLFEQVVDDCLLVRLTQPETRRRGKVDRCPICLRYWRRCPANEPNRKTSPRSLNVKAAPHRLIVKASMLTFE
jgi:hypothetical protein